MVSTARRKPSEWEKQWWIKLGRDVRLQTRDLCLSDRHCSEFHSVNPFVSISFSSWNGTCALFTESCSDTRPKCYCLSGTWGQGYTLLVYNHTPTTHLTLSTVFTASNLLVARLALNSWAPALASQILGLRMHHRTVCLSSVSQRCPLTSALNELCIVSFSSTY